MTNRRRDLVRSRQVTAGDYDTVRVVRREFGRNTPPDDAVATYDEYPLSNTCRLSELMANERYSGNCEVASSARAVSRGSGARVLASIRHNGAGTMLEDRLGSRPLPTAALLYGGPHKPG
jgi:hypothetical protein